MSTVPERTSVAISTWVLDYLLPTINADDFSVFIMLYRYFVESNGGPIELSRDEIVNGLRDEDGEILSYGPGQAMSRIYEALKHLREAKIIEVQTPHGLFSRDFRNRYAFNPHPETWDFSVFFPLMSYGRLGRYVRLMEQGHLPRTLSREALQEVVDGHFENSRALERAIVAEEWAPFRPVNLIPDQEPVRRIPDMQHQRARIVTRQQRAVANARKSIQEIVDVLREEIALIEQIEVPPAIELDAGIIVPQDDSIDDAVSGRFFDLEIADLLQQDDPHDPFPDDDNTRNGDEEPKNPSGDSPQTTGFSPVLPEDSPSDPSGDSPILPEDSPYLTGDSGSPVGISDPREVASVGVPDSSLGTHAGTRLRVNVKSLNGLNPESNVNLGDQVTYSNVNLELGLRDHYGPIPTTQVEETLSFNKPHGLFSRPLALACVQECTHTQAYAPPREQVDEPPLHALSRLSPTHEHPPAHEHTRNARVLHTRDTVPVINPPSPPLSPEVTEGVVADTDIKRSSKSTKGTKTPKTARPSADGQSPKDWVDGFVAQCYTTRGLETPPGLFSRNVALLHEIRTRYALVDVVRCEQSLRGRFGGIVPISVLANTLPVFMAQKQATEEIRRNSNRPAPGVVMTRNDPGREAKFFAPTRRSDAPPEDETIKF